MPAYLSPVGNEQQFDSNGTPLAGGLIYTYQAGTTTPIVTYTENTGVTPQANPIVLNSAGLPASPIWLPAGQAVKLVFLKSDLTTARPTIDNVLGVNDPTGIAVDQWVIYPGVATFVSATSFTVAGDQTNIFQILRRVKTTNTGGTIHSSVSNSVFGAGITTVTVVNDAGVLDSGLSSVSYALLSATNPSIPETSLGRSFRTAASVAAAIALVPIQIGALTATTSGTSIDFLTIPNWVKRITVSINNLSTSAASIPIVQIGDSGGIEVAGYSSSGTFNINTGIVGSTVTNGFLLTGQWSGASTFSGVATLALMDAATNLWAFTMTGAFLNTSATGTGGGSKALSATLDRIRLTTAGGADTFDGGSMNILYE